jgi:hypothetical protein
MPGPVHRAEYLDCCSTPTVVTIKQVYGASQDCEALCRCQNCGAYWFYRIHEYANSSGGEDDLTVWYSLLTPEQGKLILDSSGRPDLSFLSERPSFMEDAGGVQRVKGQPTYPWS